MDLVGRIEDLGRRGLAERELRIAVLDQIRSVVPFDAYAWVLTDPATGVGWSPLAEVPVLDDVPALIRSKYLTAVNRWTALPSGAAATLLGATDGDRGRSLVWRECLSRYGISDVASVVLRDRSGCWGFVDVWRSVGRFAEGECAALAAAAEAVTPGLLRALLPTFADVPAARRAGPAVLLLGDDLRPLAETAATAAHLEALLPAAPGRAVVPAAALNVAAQLGAVEAGVDDAPPEARVYVPGGSWMVARAGRIGGDGAPGPRIAVTFDAAGPAERADLYARVAGLTGREGDVLRAVIGGHDTRRAAARLGISEHTVQDHLKAIFAKTGADSRRQLAARAAGTSP